MGYVGAMEAAGAKVHTFERFGSYQGDWYAKVTYNEVTGWVHGYYGSCNYCDGFEAEFGRSDHKHYDDSQGRIVRIDGWDIPDGLLEDCPDCKKLLARYADFGRAELSEILTQEEALAEASRNADWDMEAQEMIDFITENAV